MSGATILHADLDSFYASVEQRDDPMLRGRPVIVGGGVVLAASYEAKAFGVKTAMGGREALRLCPNAVVVSPRFSAYVEASKAVFAVFEDTTPLVEAMSIDEAFLDVGGLSHIAGTPVEIGYRLRARVRAEVGLPITVGIARTKFLAKVASRVAKPDGLLLVPPEGEAAFLHPLPVDRIWGVGKVTAEKLNRRGIRTVADIAALDEPTMVSMLGVASGRHVLSLAQLRDPRPVLVGRRRRSVGAQRAMGRGPWSSEYVDAALMGLVERVTRRMRRADRRGRTVTLRLRFDDFTRATRSHTMPWSTAETALVLDVARQLLHEAKAVIDERGLTLIGISVANLDDSSRQQLELPFGRRGSVLDDVLDDVREKFGSASIAPAVLLGRDPSETVPMLPD